MVTAIWIAQGLLGVLFVITGSFKFFQSKEKIIASGGTWAEDFNPAIIKLISGAELICGLFVVVPRLLGHGHYFTFASAATISLIMTGAIFVHLKRKEFKHAIINLVFLLIALFVAYTDCPF